MKSTFYITYSCQHAMSFFIELKFEFLQDLTFCHKGEAVTMLTLSIKLSSS